MNNVPSLQVLADHRDALLLAEVAAWLHMFGKFHEKFLKGKHSFDIEIPQDLTGHFPKLDGLLRQNWSGHIWGKINIPEFNANQLSLYDLIKKHRNSKAPTGFQRLMQDAHGRGSGTDKGALDRFAPGQTTIVYGASAVGNESQAIDLTALQSERNKLYGFLETQLQNLHDANASVNWTTFRKEFIDQIEKTFRTSVAETRRPLNDISLFDQTFASVAFFKAALAQNLLLGWRDPNQEKVADKYHWRILRVGIDGLRFWGQSAKLTDLLGRKACIERALDSIQQLLEQEYPLGAEVYRDENGSLFVVPDVANLLDAFADGVILRTRLQQIAQKELEDESNFTLTLSDKTRTMLTFGQLANSELPPPSANPDAVRSMWQALKETTDVCTVCGVRPQGYDGPDQPINQKALQRNVCGICERRRVDRASEWADKLQTTVWTNEVADANGRLALIVGRFGLDDWLTGNALSSVMAFEPSTRNLTNPRNNKVYRFDYSQFIAESQQLLSSSKQPDGQTPLLNYLLLSYQRVGNSFFDTYDFYISGSDLDNGKREAHLFALALMRQQPSPARLRRIWETTRDFWQDVLNERDAQGKPILVPAEKRLEIIPHNSAQLNLGKFHSYDLVVNNIRVSVVWDSKARRFIICENFAYLASPEQLGKPLQEYLQPGKTFVLEESSGVGVKNKILTEITIQSVKQLPDDYLPVIPILAEPRTFMLLVPADRALELVKAIKSKYEREMGKVRNRLPLHLGAVFFGRRTPLFAALDSARQMLQQPVTSEQWRVSSLDGNGQIKFENGITWHVPTRMGDGQTLDVWYPYWRVEGKPNGRARWFIGPDGEHWVHVNDLKNGDTVTLTPSTFDFLWLDAAARRFEVSYDQKGRRPARPTRPYYLENLERLEQVWDAFSKLSRTQLKQTLQTIEAARERWFGPDALQKSAEDETFRQFAQDTLANAQWPKEQSWKSMGIASAAAPPRNDMQARLIDAAVHGELTDWAELHLEILKEKA